MVDPRAESTNSWQHYLLLEGRAHGSVLENDHGSPSVAQAPVTASALAVPESFYTTVLPDLCRLWLCVRKMAGQFPS